ncbi:hypothetical protein CDG61_07160 [Acinetobacter sp. WCHAc010052]|nr:hypothetical protein CDG61_07160 [Acinetobacter sp. WCHAc010052]
MPSCGDACTGVPGGVGVGMCSAEWQLKTVQHSAIRNMQTFREDGIFFFKCDFSLYELSQTIHPEWGYSLMFSSLSWVADTHVIYVCMYSWQAK